MARLQRRRRNQADVVSVRAPGPDGYRPGTGPATASRAAYELRQHDDRGSKGSNQTRVVLDGLAVPAVLWLCVLAIVLEAAGWLIAEFVDSLVPKRPMWLRRLVQALWVALAALLLITCVFGLVYLVEAL